LKKLIFTIFALGVASILSATDITVSWKAFKTPLKIGVGGKFDNIKSSGDTLNQLKVEIDTLSVNSNNAGRDATLVKSFFEIQDVTKIYASVKSVTDSVLTVELFMNGVKRETPMKITEKDGESLTALGFIDLADFGMIPSLRSINSACFDLHSGKTWQDIEIEVQIKK
jgi:polyisoprenoid-binding protein YceI